MFHKLYHFFYCFIFCILLPEFKKILNSLLFNIIGIIIECDPYSKYTNKTCNDFD